MSPSPDMALPQALERFTPVERWTHRLIAIDMGILLVTAACLYIPDISALVGHRTAVRFVHVAAGVLLPIPLVVAAFFASFRLDASRLNRFTPADWEWLRSRQRRSGAIAVGKFNAGQKLNAAFTLAMIIIMFVTGLIMAFGESLPIDWRTGATFVHDWLTIAIVVIIAGHAWMAARDPEARRGMRTGFVSPTWAQREHAAWALACADGPDQRDGLQPRADSDDDARGAP